MHEVSPTLDLSPINSAELITQCTAELSGLIEAKKLRIRVRFEDYQSPMIHVDKGKFSRVIINIMENAIKYSPTGSAITVSINRSPDESMVEISVSDEGIGIKKEEIEMIFTQFHRGSNVGRIKGTGLGLYITKKMLDLMKGEIFIYSEGLGKGTKVVILIPMSKDVKPKSLEDSKIII